jgi:type I restriction enzyme R subunit
MLHEIDYEDFRTNTLRCVRAVADHILPLDDGKRRIADAVLAAMHALALCCTLDAALPYRDELAFFQAVRAVLTKGDPTSTLNDEAREHALRQIISKAVVSSEVVDIFTAAGLPKPNVGILSDEFLENVRKMKEKISPSSSSSACSRERSVAASPPTWSRTASSLNSSTTRS